MKQFFKTVAAVLVAFAIISVVNTVSFLTIMFIVGLSGSSKPSVHAGSALKIDMSKITIAEQSLESNPFAGLSGQNVTTTIGIWDAVSAINTAADDSAIDYIFLKTDGVSGGMAQIEEFRAALQNFHNSGKPILSYTENPTNGSYYLASVADKVYMTSSQGGMNAVVGLSSQVIFLKDILDKLGVNVQLIRHGKYKSAGEMYIKNDISPENREQYETFIGTIWKGWSEEIAESRHITPERFNAMIDNLELNLPQDFLNAGLVDELLDKQGLDSKLASYSAVLDIDKAKFISLEDYITARAKSESLLKNKIAVIYVDGEIVDGSEKQQVAGDRFAKIINDVRKNSTVKAVVFRVNSPGGSVLASEKIKNEVDRLAAEKPVIASYANYAASGGYWISNSCRRIYTDKSTLTGSIGVFSMIPDFSKTAKDLAHINVVTISSNKHGDMYSMMRPLDKKELDYMQQSVEVIYDRFVNLVAEGRGLRPEAVDSIAQGRVWAGADALEIGLVDEIGTLEDAINYAASLDPESSSDLSGYDIVGFPKPQTVLETLLETMYGGESAFAGTPFEGVEQAFRGFSKDKAGQVYARLPYQIELN